MKQRFIWASILSMAVLMTGCGFEDALLPEDFVEKEAATTTAPAETTEATTEGTTEAITEESVEETTAEENDNVGENSTEAVVGGETAEGGEVAEGDEAAQVQAAIDGYIKAIEEADYANIVKYYDIELLQHMATGKKHTEDELIAEVKRMADSGELAVGPMNAEIGKPECLNSEAQEYNDFLASDMLAEIENENGETVKLNLAENYKIDGVYTFRYTASSAGMNVDMDMAVLRINGEWKVDSVLTMTMALAEAFGSMT